MSDKTLYAVPFWDCGTPSFVSADLFHYGYEEDLHRFYELCKKDGKDEEHVNALKNWFETGNGIINVAYIEQPVAVAVEEIGSSFYTHDNVYWTFMNVWDFPIDLRAEKIERDVKWICHDGKYLRAAKYFIKEIRVKLSNGYKPINFCMGNYNVVLFDSDDNETHEDSSTTLYIVERLFESKDECMRDMNKPEFKPDTDLRGYCFEVFADG